MKPGIGWPIGITMILATTVVANLVVMRIANNDPSFSVEPDYYKKAVFFDSTMVQAQRNVDLGWTAESSVDAIVPGMPTRLRVQLRDREARPLLGVVVTATVLFNARANERTTVTLRDEGGGVYAAAMPINVPGVWEVRVDARRDSAHLSTSARIVAVRAR
jgi:nitrogen fixation protein FixH